MHEDVETHNRLKVDCMSPGRALVTGGAGFIGSHLVDRLLDLDWEVSVVDDLSSGRREWVQPHLGQKGFRFLEGDINDDRVLAQGLEGVEHVFHMAADPVIRGGFDDPQRRYSSMRNNILGTHALLEGMVRSGASQISFSSSSVVYGEASVVPTPESYGPARPVSIYGASKLAGEGLVTAYSHGMGLAYWIFRFANIVGARAQQGVVCDFIAKLRKDPRVLEILGDGRQEKCYMHVQDCVDAMLFCVKRSENQILNLGTETPLSVERVAKIVVDEMGLEGVRFAYSGGDRGWRGDLPRTYLDTRKLRALGFRAKRDSEEAVRSAVVELLNESG